MPSSSRAPRSKIQHRAATAVVATSPEAAAVHDLQNTLASIKLRLAVLAADPTCRWAQEENVAALLRLMDLALAQTTHLRQQVKGNGVREKRSRARE
jgi:hypothetical protein